MWSRLYEECVDVARGLRSGDGSADMESKAEDEEKKVSKMPSYDGGIDELDDPSTLCLL